ncbi:hypothetical protein QP185_18935 [Sphingomonas aerolata]|uniref:hypothetical protein n=1 Tax=Sphingomonas aerolata TaxID=185951 RepID=UPI002FE14EDB
MDEPVEPVMDPGDACRGIAARAKCDDRRDDPVQPGTDAEACRARRRTLDRVDQRQADARAENAQHELDRDREDDARKDRPQDMRLGVFARRRSSAGRTPGVVVIVIDAPVE